MSEGENRIMIFGPKDDGTYVVEFRTAAGEALAISIPRSEASGLWGLYTRITERVPEPRFRDSIQAIVVGFGLIGVAQALRLLLVIFAASYHIR
jgi:hypothetical protein